MNMQENVAVTRNSKLATNGPLAHDTWEQRTGQERFASEVRKMSPGRLTCPRSPSQVEVGVSPLSGSKGLSCSFPASHPLGVLPCHLRVSEVSRTGAAAWASSGPAYKAAPWRLALKGTVSTTGLLLLSRAELLKSWCVGYFILFLPDSFKPLSCLLLGIPMAPGSAPQRKS